MKRKRGFKKGDLFLILLVGVIVSIPLLWGVFTSGSNQEDELIAVITRNGERIAELNLSTIEEPQHIHLEEGIPLTVLAEKGRIRVEEADCPDKICVKAGWLTKPGDRAVCLPSKTIVTIEGEGTLISSLTNRLIMIN